MKIFASFTCLCALTFGSLSADCQETNHFAFTVGGGFTTPFGTAGSQTNMGWDAGAGIGVNLNSRVGALIDVDYNSFGISGSTLVTLDSPSGGFHVLSATLIPLCT